MKPANQPQEPQHKPSNGFGAGIVDGQADGGPKDRAMPKGPRKGRRPTTFQCSLGQTWDRLDGEGLEAKLRALGASVTAPREPVALGPAFAAEVAKAALDRLAPDSAFADEVGAELEDLGLSGNALYLTQPFSPFTQTELDEYAAALPLMTQGILVRLSTADAPADVVRSVTVAVCTGLPVLVLSDPVLPDVAVEVVDAVLDIDAGALVQVIHDDGLTALRHAAGLSWLALDLSFPNAAVTTSVLALRDKRLAAEAEDAVEAQSLVGDEESAGWFGSGVVAEPFSPVVIHAAAHRSRVVGLDEDPVAVAHEVVEAAFGPAVLGGYSTASLSQVLAHPRIFSRLTEEILARVEEVEQDMRYEPPYWVTRGLGGYLEGLLRIRRLGLDGGATLIYEQSTGGTRPHRAILTNVEPRMRIAQDLRVLGVLSLIRSAADQRTSPD